MNEWNLLYQRMAPESARESLGQGWRILHLEERPFRQWETQKRVVVCIAAPTTARVP